MASTIPSLLAGPVEIEPAAIYGSANAPILLRIATGGAGQTGMLQALCEAFISCVTQKYPLISGHFSIAWLCTDTSASFNALASRSADIAITYHPAAEKIAVSQGFAVSRTHLWLDTFNLVGPSSDPAGLIDYMRSLDDVHQDITVYSLFAQIFMAAVAPQTTKQPIRFLSRWDKSANNILESRIWTSIGQTPWSLPVTSWYHQYPAFPRQALLAAAVLGEYTLVDRGTWLSLREHESVRDKMSCFLEGSITDHRNSVEQASGSNVIGEHSLAGDHLSNPAHGLLSPAARDMNLAKTFLEWMIDRDGGQKLLEEFTINGEQLHGCI